MEQYHGLLVVNKPQGITSAACTYYLKKMGQRKIGHAGTLDPMAQGVLLILLGHGTKIFNYLLEGGEKVYKATICFGQTTDTWDSEGQVLTTQSWEHITPEEVKDHIFSWRGINKQLIPPYSAAKHQGQPLYTLSRKGKNTPHKTKTIEISCVEVLTVNLPYVTFRVTCSSGTYIRSLAHSLGMRMRCGAVLTELTREYSYPFGLDTAIPFEDLVINPDLLLDRIIPITAALPDWSIVVVNKSEVSQIKNGIPLFRRDTTCVSGKKTVLLLEDGTPLALAEAMNTSNGAVWTLLRGLWT